MLLLKFSVCAVIILYTASKISWAGDVIADRTGIGRQWIGLVLLASVTSLPELVTGISAVTLNNLPDMAVSGTMGSCMFNMLVIAMLEMFSKDKPVSSMVHQGHILSAGFGIVLVGFAAIDILFGKYLPVLTFLHRSDPLSITFIVVYLIAMKLMYSHEKTRLAESIQASSQTNPVSTQSLSGAITIFVVNALFLVGAACYIPELGAQIAAMTGWGPSFIGSSFVAITTSLPELVVSISAARRGSFDMAVANLLGSNLFDIAILGIMDYCYLKEPLLRVVSPSNSLLALTAMICMGIAVIGLTYRSEKKWLFVTGDALAICCVYVFANVLMFVAH